ncbi:MAG: uracil-DNA glycosylase [Verrucomicrobiota bacterium]
MPTLRYILLNSGMPQSNTTTDALHFVKRYLHQLKEDGETRLSISQESLQTLTGMPAKYFRLVNKENNPPSYIRETPPHPKDTPSLAILEKHVVAANLVKELGTLRDIMVFAVGNPNADLMFVGEAPGAEEEKKREPFVGPAGQLLTKIIQAMGLKRTDVYISNVVKYRPAIGNGQNQGPKNRPPSPEEIDAFLPFLLQEIDTVQPEVIVALGGTAAKGLLNIDESVGRMRGQAHQLNGVPVLVTYHPSYLLRNHALSERRKVWEDMLDVMARLGLPITEKQKNFFR